MNVNALSRRIKKLEKENASGEEKIIVIEKLYGEEDTDHNTDSADLVITVIKYAEEGEYIKPAVKKTIPTDLEAINLEIEKIRKELRADGLSDEQINALVKDGSNDN